MDAATIRLIILDKASGESTPARVEVFDTEGNRFIAEDALPTGGD